MPVSRSRNCRPMPSEMMIDGMMRLATVTKKRALLPASFLRNARPASTESTTVKAMTTAPSASERLKAAPMSTVPSPSASL
ncbi:Uncharacterised protein [Mycobacterium tuberculosis]|nr:Uncharacterised protein [Mycobacterium tuberculosis]